MAKQHNPVHLNILQTINGIGHILALKIIYEIGDINRFSSVQKFTSYTRLVKCKVESAEKT
jgi:transposase